MKLLNRLFYALFLVSLAFSGQAQTYLLSEDFSSAFGSKPPSKWDTAILSGSATDVWRFDNPGNRTVSFPIVGNFAIFDSENYSAAGGKEKVVLETPYVDCSFGPNIILYFDHIFVGGKNGKASVEVFDGAKWVIYKTYTASTSGVVSETLDLSSLIGGITNAKVRFTWEGDGSNYWIIDNIKLLAPLAKDARLKSMDSPSMPFDPGTSPVKVTLKNDGYQTLNAVRIQWSVNNVMQTPYQWNGNLAFDQEAQNIQLGSQLFPTGSLKNIKIWLEAINGSTDLNQGNDTISTKVAAKFCGTFTIGGTNPDFTSFKEAGFAVSSAGVSCPVVFKVRNGIYNEQVSLFKASGASSVNLIKFESESGDSSKALVDYQSSDLSNDFSIGLSGAEYVTFSKLGIRRTNGTNSVRIGNASHHISFLNCMIGNVVSPSTSTDSALVFRNNNMEGFSLDLSQPALAASRNIIVENNVLNDLNITYTREVSIQQNRLRRISMTRDTMVSVISNSVLFNAYDNNLMNGIGASSSADIQLRSNTIKLNGGCYNYQLNGINLTSTSNVILQQNSITVNSGSCYNYEHTGIRISGFASRQVQIFNNDISIGGNISVRYGISVNDGDSLYIRKNKFNATDLTYNGTGIVINNIPRIVEIDSNEIKNFLNIGISINPPVYSKYQIRNNLISVVRDNGILISGTGGNVVGNRIIKVKAGIGLNVNSSNTLLANNYIHAEGFSNAKGISLQAGAQGSRLIHNAVNITGRDMDNGRALEILGGSDYIIRNNIFANVGGGYTAYINVSPSVLDADNNDYFSRTGKKLANINGSIYNTLPEFRSATGKDLSSFSVDPFFTNDTTLLMHQRLLNDAGVSFSEVQKDIDGFTRGVNPDIGVNEIDQCSNDAGINGFTDIPVVLSAGNTNVKVILQNHGTAQLKNVRINWSVNNVSQTAFNWSGTLNGLENQVVNIGTYNFLSGKKYELRAWTTITGGSSDCDPYNDTTKIYPLNTPLCGTYTIGGSAPDFINFSDASFALSNSGVGCSVLFKVRPGNYDEQIKFFDIKGISAINNVVFESENLDSNSVTLNYSVADGSSNFTLGFVGASYITFRKMGILRSSGELSVIIQNGSHHISIENCRVGHLTTSPNMVDSMLVFRRNNMNGYDMNLEQPGHIPARGIYVENNILRSLRINNSIGVLVSGNTIAFDENRYWDQTYFATNISNSENVNLISNNISIRYTGGCRNNVYGLSLQSVRNSIFENNVINVSGGCDPRNGYGIYGSGYFNRSNRFIGNSISLTDNLKVKYGLFIDNGDSLYLIRNKIDGKDFLVQAYGIQMNNVPLTVVIDSNEVRNFTTTGMILPHPINGNWKVRYNLLSSNKEIGMLVSGFGGEYIGNKVIRMKSGTGVQLGAFNALFANNYIHAEGTGTAKGLVVVESASGSRIYHNAINITGTDKENGRAIEVQGGSGYKIYNNIFSNNGGGFAAHFKSVTAPLDIDYNNYFSSGVSLASFNDKNIDSLSRLSIATGSDKRSLSVFPFFKSDTLLVPNHASLNGTAKVIAEVTDDINKTKRSEKPDIGAHEIEPCSIDGGIASFYGLSNPMPAGVAMVKVLLKNHGLSPISSASIGWNVNGIAQSEKTWTGSLASGDSIVVSLGNYVFPPSTALRLKSWTSSINGQADCNLLNDTTRVLEIGTQYCGIYTIGGVNPDFATVTDAAKAMNTIGVSCPVFLRIRNGVYDEQIKLFKIPGASSTSPVVFEGESRDSSKVELHYKKFEEANDFTLGLVGTEFVSFRNMGIKRSNGNLSLLIQNGSHDIVVENCQLGNVTSSALTSDSILRFSNNDMSGYDLKLYQPAGTPARSIIVENNYFKNLLLSNSVDIIIKNNQGTNIQNSYSQDWDIQRCKNIIISNNRMRSAYFQNDTSLTFIENSIYYGTRHPAWVAFFGLSISRSKGVVVEKNNVNVTNQDNCTYSLFGMYIENDASCHLINNNILTRGTCPSSGNIIGYYLIGRNNNVIISTNSVSQVGQSSNRNGILVQGEGGDSLYFKKNTIINEDINFLSSGIRVSASIAKMVEIDSNEIRNYQQSAIEVTPSSFASYKIRNNYLIGNRERGININGPGAIVHSNRIWGMRAGIGINVNGSNTTIANNYIHAGGSGLAKGIVLQAGASGSRVVFNSVNINSTDIVNGVGLEILGGTNYVIKNNILSNSGGGYALYSSSIPALKEWDYNAYHSSGNNFGYLVNQPYSNLSQWGTALSGDANAKKLNPNFPTDSTALPYQKQLNGAGISSSGVLLDIDGDLRNLQAPDIGAKEFLVDYGVTRLTSPTNECRQNDATPVTVFVRQFGDIPFVNLKIAYQMNGGQIYYDTIPGSVENDIQYTFRQKQNLGANGTYTFKIWLVDNGDDNLKNDTLVVVRKSKSSPVVDFSFIAQCAGIPVPFQSTATVPVGTIDKLEWDFGDSTFATGNSPLHAFDSSKSYLVKLQAYSNEGCYTEVQKTVTVKPTPLAGFSVGDGCAGTSISFTNKTFIPSGMGSVVYNWDFGNTEVSVTESPVATYPLPGNYTVTLRANASNGCGDTISQMVKINPLKVLRVEVDSVFSRKGGTVQLKGIPSGGVFSGPGVIGNSFIPVLAGVGEHIITYTYGDTVTGCSNSIEKKVRVQDPPIILAGPAELIICKGGNAKLSVVATGTDLQFQWFKNGLALSGKTDSVLTINNVGLSDTGYYHAAVWNLVDTMKTANGRIDAEKYSTLQVTTCDKYLWNGNEYSATGTYYFKTTTSSGCDSVAILQLTIKKSKRATVEIESCGRIEWNGKLYSETGEYYFTTQTVEKCDSIILLKLKIKSRKTTVVNITACEKFVRKGITYNQNFSYIDSLLSAEGCDSLVTNIVTIQKPDSVIQFAEACESYFWNGKEYKENGEFSYRTVSSRGCDSVTTLKLKIKKPSFKYFDTTNCLSYLWRGRLIKASGEYKDTLINSTGCDSILVLRVKITEPVTRDTIVKSCVPVKWRGQLYDQSGEYKYRLVSSTGCDSNIVMKLTIQKPKTDFNADDSVKCLINNRVAFKNNSVSNMGSRLYTWNFAGQDTSNEESPQYSFKSEGEFKVTLITRYVEYGCTDSVSRWIKILPNPVKPLLAVIGNPNFCEGETTYLFAGENTTYRWYKDGFLMEGDSTKVFKPLMSGLYTVVGVDKNGCKGVMSDPALIVVNKKPLTPSVLKKEYLLCMGSVAQPLEAEAPQGTQVLWYLPNKGDTSDFKAPVPSTLKAGTFNYFVKSRSFSGCESPLVKIVVSVGSIKKPEIEWINNLLQSDSGYTSYEWISNGKSVGNSQKHTFKPTLAGLYRVRVTNSYGCSDTSSSYNLVVTAINGVSDNSYAAMQVYPNPFVNKIVIDAGERPIREYTIRLYSSKGEMVQRMVSKRQLIEIPTAGLISGQYMVEVSEGLKRKTVRVVKNE